MRTFVRGACLFVLMSGSAALAEADPFSFLADGSVVFNTAVSTQGTFTCRGPLVCSGTGTNSITFGTADNHATITFTGVDKTLQVGNHAIPITLGVSIPISRPGSSSRSG